MSMFVILLIAAAAFVVYAMVTQYENTGPGKGWGVIPKRVWAALALAAAALIEAFTGFVQGIVN